MNELTQVRTTVTIGAEIRTLTVQAKYMTLWFGVQIGRRLSEAKEMLPYGSFGEWLKNETEFSTSSAQRFMKLNEEYGAEMSGILGGETDCPTLGKLSVSNALRLLALPSEEREEFAEANDVEHMSSRQLDELLAERDAALRRAEKAEEELAAAGEGAALSLAEKEDRIAELEEERDRALDKARDLKEELSLAGEEQEKLEQELKELRERPIDVAVEVDSAAVEKAAEEARAEANAQWKAQQEELEKKLAEVESKREALQQAVKTAEEKANAAAGQGEEERRKLTDEVSRLSKQLEMADPQITTFKVHFEQWQTEYRKMEDLLAAIQGDKQEKLRTAVKAVLKSWAV